ncbi:30S ribosomal protein S16 [Candidatus Falkowbacteria bacterium CG10_big_fil_rev_8_21_14_0_10_37_14]|uniref:Small ribosomal subunit protein bS16 n=1 Tax=Candidatus Falkowbacteria bacterium CG10_big_fil_rev_8_21_14_0_10_37_14 TaxID=1974561 RepID=A0A2M6WTM0_9BACT|nr:30S ribosomal protein S16 [Candidatus Falkowbacteria bacterium]PIT96101.1 MAG: 30S ribosomal protein S16 [Candidatus Falkowbacteria bacterium CG10_big_fil_rev_8_21_14_0_10_37_14]
MLTIKLARKGKKGLPMYRLIVSEKGRDTYGNSLEILGSYNPHNKQLEVSADRIKHWIEVGAQMTGTVNNLLVDREIIKGEKLRVSRLSKKMRTEMAKKVAAEKKQALEAKKQESADVTEAKVVAEEAAKAPIEETPVESVEAVKVDETTETTA